MLGPSGSGKSTIFSLVGGLIERAGLEGYESAYPDTLSGGMRQRVAFICSLLSPQSLMLLGEPFGALDELTRLDMQDWLLKMWETDRRSVLFITHSIEEALYMSDRILILSNKPARVIKEIEVPFERPRHHDMTLDAHFIKLKREIYLLLKEGGQDD